MQWAARIIREENRARALNVAKLRRDNAKQAQRELTAQWRALKKLGALQTKVTPAMKRLTKSRAAAIRKAYAQIQQVGHFTAGRVERPLKKVQVGKRVKYTLAPHFKFIKTKRKPKTNAGIVRTKKGAIVEVENPMAKVRINKSGQVIERDEYTSGGVTITREGLSGVEILLLVDAIKAGKFHLPKGSMLTVFNFGWAKGSSYMWDALDELVLDIERYEQTMMPTQFEAWLKMTEITLQEFTFQRRV